jgi:[ribosomal protein S5]-alanine N-acetyltransferase
MYLETKRLIIRSFNETDVKDVFEYLSDETVMEYIEPIMTYEEAVSFVNNTGIKNKLVFAIVLKNINKVIGHLIFHKYTSKNCYEIGWIINKGFWNKGYALEASNKIIKYGFEELKIKKIIGETEEKNIKSIKTLEKIGMEKTGKNKDGLIEYEIKI